jgi:hypothetical protein
VRRLSRRPRNSCRRLSRRTAGRRTSQLICGQSSSAAAMVL